VKLGRQQILGIQSSLRRASHPRETGILSKFNPFSPSRPAELGKLPKFSAFQAYPRARPVS
jgi:hypothetical protein